MKALETEINFFNANVTGWRAYYAGKYVLIKGEKLLGTFDQLDDAVEQGAAQFGTEPFLIRKVVNADQVKNENNVYIPTLDIGLLNANLARSV